MISKTHIEVAELDLMTAIIACENATVADRIKKFSSLAEQLLKERDALIKAYVEKHFDSCEGCGITEDDLRQEIIEEAQKIMDSKP